MWSLRRHTIILVITLALGFILVLAKSQIPNPPHTYPLTLTETLVVILLLQLWLVAAWRNWRTRSKSDVINNLVIVLICVAVGALAISSISPAFKTIPEAQEYNQQLQKAAEYGVQVGQAQNSGQKPPTRLDQPQLDHTEREIAKAAETARTAIRQGATPAQAVAQATQTVPLTNGEWNCTEQGCAYLSDAHVFTISHDNRVLGSLVLATVMLMVTVVTNDLWIAKLIKYARK